MKAISVTNLIEQPMFIVPTQIKYWVAFTKNRENCTRIFFRDGDSVEVLDTPEYIAQQFDGEMQ